MTIKLTSDIRHGGAIVPANTTVTYDPAVEADLVARKSATYVGAPATTDLGVPAMVKQNLLTGGIRLSAAGKPAVLLDSYRSAPRALEQNPPRGLGVRTDALATLQAQDTWLGNSFDHIIGFAEKGNGANPWATNLADTIEFLGKFASAPRDIKWAMPICTGVEPIGETIAGTHDAVITQIAQTIADAAVGSTISVRLGWEPNFSTSYPWGWTLVSAADYIAAFRRVSDIFRSVDSRFQIDYCVATRVDTAYPFEDRYPGDAYVDVIGVDAYLLTEDKGAMTDREHVEFVFSGPCGINRVRDFALSRGKKMAIDEWGVNYDNPLYVERIADFVRANNVTHHAYWDQNNSFFTCKLSGDQHPNSAYAFVRNFGPFHIDTWCLSANPGQPLSGVVSASKPIVRLEVIDGDATAVGRNGVIAGPQVSGSRRITVKAYDERGVSATRSIVLTWQAGRTWTPAELGANLGDWISADLSAQTSRHLNAIKSLTSLVGSGRAATAQTAGQRPTFGYQNGRPKATLDGGDALVQTDVTGVPAAQAAVTYAAMLYTDPAAANFTYFLSDADSGASVRALGINGGNLRIGSTGGYAGGNIIGAEHSIVVSFGAGATASCRGSIDGNEPATNTVAIPAATYTRRVLGATTGAANVIGSYYSGYLYELFCANVVMSAGQEDQTHGYFAWKYGLEANLPGGHAYKFNPPMV
ncbi:MAG TPA: glycosyl hydrolase [Denitromonas sp.]|nr:glycosyl hydrolase [Denitromonas sp.]